MPTTKPTALIIDDEEDLCRLMQITLTKMGIVSDVAYDVKTAFEFLATKSYDFCLTDLALPDGSGLDIVTKVAGETDTPIAVISAHGDVDVAIQALKLGAFDFVNKPLELPRLRTLVESALKVRADIRADSAVDKPAQSESTKTDSLTMATPTTKLTTSTKTNADANSEITKTKMTPAKPAKAGDDKLLDDRLIGESQPMQQLRTTIKKLARSQAPVFLWGGSGTGKEVVSRLIHDLSPRRDGSFVPVNCGAIPSELMESEFFGHKKGSFTGATSDKIGLFQQADGGTLFLDEVADLPLAMQVKLLRAIQEKTVRAIGDTKEVPVDIRIVCATHKDLAALVQKGAFRQDLFYRINVIEVKLPALNERRDDIPMLAQHFLTLIAKDWQLDNLSLTDAATTLLSHHDFKGNVRELRNILERAVTMSDSSQIDAHHLSLDDEYDIEALISRPTPSVTSTTTPNQPATTSTNQHASGVSTNTPIVSEPTTDKRTTEQGNSPFATYQLSPYHDNRPTYMPHPLVKDNKPAPKQGISISAGSNYGTQQKPKESKPIIDTDISLPPEGLEAYLLEQEKQFITAALHRSGGNKTQAAKLLGMSFRSFRYRLKKLGIDDNDDDE